MLDRIPQRSHQVDHYRDPDAVGAPEPAVYGRVVARFRTQENGQITGIAGRGSDGRLFYGIISTVVVFCKAGSGILTLQAQA